MECFASDQYVIITLMFIIGCIPMALYQVYMCLTHVISSDCSFAEAHKSKTTALIIIVMTAYLGGQRQKYPRSRSLPHSHMHNTKNRHDVYCFQASAALVHDRLFLDSGASRSIIHDAELLINIRPIQDTCTV
jgi:hypothetical protein